MRKIKFLLMLALMLVGISSVAQTALRLSLWLVLIKVKM